MHWLVGCLVGLFYGMPTLAGTFNTEVNLLLLPETIWFQVKNDNNHLSIIIPSINHS